MLLARGKDWIFQKMAVGHWRLTNGQFDPSFIAHMALTSGLPHQISMSQVTGCSWPQPVTNDALWTRSHSKSGFVPDSRPDLSKGVIRAGAGRPLIWQVHFYIVRLHRALTWRPKAPAPPLIPIPCQAEPVVVGSTPFKCHTAEDYLHKKHNTNDVFSS